jgi:hypothetical protein
MATNALDLVPAFSRQIRVYNKGASGLTESQLAGYIADAVQALMFRWDRTYSVTQAAPMNYTITPDIEEKDIRPIILMASIIYKMGSVGLVAFTDGDFSYNPKGGLSSLELDRSELLSYLPKLRLAKPSVGQLFGWKSIFNPEGYDWYNAVFFIY